MWHVPAHAYPRERAFEGFSKRDQSQSVFVEHGFDDEEVGTQNDGFPFLSVDRQGWWWIMCTCIHSLETESLVYEEYLVLTSRVPMPR